MKIHLDDNAAPPVVLCLPFVEKDEAKALGARWNPDGKFWYVPEGYELGLFEKWLPRTFLRDLHPEAFMAPVLTVEAVPSTCQFSNVRTLLDPHDWDLLRRHTYDHAGRRCQICGDKGPDHPVEAHEIWEYDEAAQVQKLAGLIALCPPCHRVKHIGMAKIQGRAHEAIRHLMAVNRWSMAQVASYLERDGEIYRRRSAMEWSLDLSWLVAQGYNVDTSNRWSERALEARRSVGLPDPESLDEERTAFDF